MIGSFLKATFTHVFQLRHYHQICCQDRLSADFSNEKQLIQHYLNLIVFNTNFR